MKEITFAVEITISIKDGKGQNHKTKRAIKH
jgi:hypothetical protein